MPEMSMEEFLGHTTTAGGSGNYLENWKKKRTPPQIDTFIHPKSRIIAVWQHAWPKMHTRKDPATGVETVEIWGGTFNSWEPEALLKKQYHREPKVTGQRVLEPTLCPMSIMIETVHTAIREGDLDWCEELFRFVGTDPTKAKVLHAGGLYNAFGHKSVTDKQKAEITAAGISLKTSWQENMMAKCNYIFTIVDADNPEIGPQVTTETTLLGDKVKTVIQDEMTSSICAADPTGRAGNPIANPYCIRWVHNPTAKAFGDKYKALIMRKIEVDDAIQAAFEEDAPDVSFMSRRGNIKKLKDSMEAAYVGPDDLLDFVAIFAAAEQTYAKENPTATIDEAEAVVAQAKAIQEARTPDVGREPEAAPAEAATTEAVAPKRKRRTKAEMVAAKQEKELLPLVGDMNEEDCLATLDEPNLTETLKTALQARVEECQAAAEPVAEEEAPKATGDAPDEEMFGCDKCDHPMKGSEDTCGKCGQKYNLETGEMIEETKPKPRSRSAAAKAAAAGESGDRINF